MKQAGTEKYSPGHWIYRKAVAIAADAPKTQPERLDSAPCVAGNEGYACYRVPALVISAKGTVLAFCEGRVQNHKDEVRQDWAQYHDTVTAADAIAGRHLKELADAGLAEHNRATLDDPTAR
jgi:hypothetical protein